MCFAALGTDTGGSIRIPASFTGIVGLKPTFGRVSTHGVYPLGHTLDHVGPLARTVADAGIVYQVISGFDPEDPHSVDRPPGEIALRKSLQGIRIGLPGDYFFEGLQPEVEYLVRGVAPVLEQCGAELVPIRLPDMAELTEASRLTLTVEARLLHEDHLASSAADLGADVRALLEKGKGISAADYARAQLARLRVRRELQRVFEHVDALITPTTALPAFHLGETKVLLGGREDDARLAATRFSRCFNASGHPALSLCCGFTREGLPVGLQIVGALWNEAAVLHIAYAYEQATAWKERRPPLP
jgi:aspartyl-tRNA(Asn)/glutamyl-tRNA(Gln) amidotransferase subunit A